MAALAEIDWPDDLPLGLIAGRKYSTVDPTIRSELSYGRSFQRSGFDATESTFSMDFLFTDEQAREFERFWHNDLGQGIAYFNMRVKTPYGFGPWPIRIIGIYDGAGFTAPCDSEYGAYWKYSVSCAFYLPPYYINQIDESVGPMSNQNYDIVHYAPTLLPIDFGEIYKVYPKLILNSQSGFVDWSFRATGDSNGLLSIFKNSVQIGAVEIVTGIGTITVDEHSIGTTDNISINFDSGAINGLALTMRYSIGSEI